MAEVGGTNGPGCAPQAPPWYVRQTPAGRPAQTDSAPLNLLILHWDPYPTARRVYRECIPGRGHSVTWVERGEPGTEDFTVKKGKCLEEVLCPFPIPDKTPNLLVRFLRNRWRKRRDFMRKCLWVWRKSGQEDFDFIQARDLVPEALLGWLVCRRRKCCFAYQLDFPHPEGHLNRTDEGCSIRERLSRVKWRAQALVRDFLMRRAKLVFVISEEMRELYLRKGVQPERISVFPVGVGEEFRSFDGQRRSVRDELGVGEQPVIAYLGNLAPSRDRGRMFEILRGVHQACPSARFLILGKGCDVVDSLIGEYGIREAVVLAGTVPYEDVPRLLSACDIGLYWIDVDVPRNVHKTMSPLKVAEYMASGLCTVASPIPEAKQLLESSGGGIVIQGNSVPDFVDTLSRCCGDLERVQQMGRLAREYVYCYKTFDELSDLVVASYRRALNMQRRGDNLTPEG